MNRLTTVTQTDKKPNDTITAYEYDGHGNLKRVIDANGHVNNVAYVHWMQDVAIGHFESLGGTAIMEEHGATWVARSHHIEYLRPTFAGDEITIRTWIEDMARATSKRRYEFLKNDAPDTLVARGETTWVFLDVATGRPKRIPKSMVEAVRAR